MSAPKAFSTLAEHEFPRHSEDNNDCPNRISPDSSFFGAFREFATMQDRMNRMNRLFRESYSPDGPEEALTTTSFAPPVDIYEDEHNITLKLEVPGIDEKDIDVRIENNTLTVHGERNIEKEEKEENFRRIERQYGSFTRSFTLPSSVDVGQV